MDRTADWKVVYRKRSHDKWTLKVHRHDEVAESYAQVTAIIYDSDRRVLQVDQGETFTFTTSNQYELEIVLNNPYDAKELYLLIKPVIVWILTCLSSQIYLVLCTNVSEQKYMSLQIISTPTDGSRLTKQQSTLFYGQKINESIRSRQKQIPSLLTDWYYGLIDGLWKRRRADCYVRCWISRSNSLWLGWDLFCRSCSRDNPTALVSRLPWVTNCYSMRRRLQENKQGSIEVKRTRDQQLLLKCSKMNNRIRCSRSSLWAPWKTKGS